MVERESEYPLDELAGTSPNVSPDDLQPLSTLPGDETLEFSTTKTIEEGEKPQQGPREPWEMTQQQYFENSITTDVANGISEQDARELTDRDQLNKQHRAHITMALAENKPVPATILAEYPDLPEKATGTQQAAKKDWQEGIAQWRKENHTVTRSGT